MELIDNNKNENELTKTTLLKKYLIKYRNENRSEYNRYMKRYFSLQEKKYQCKHCIKNFKTKQILNRHQSVHNNI